MNGTAALYAVKSTFLAILVGAASLGMGFFIYGTMRIKGIAPKDPAAMVGIAVSVIAYYAMMLPSFISIFKEMKWGLLAALVILPFVIEISFFCGVVKFVPGMTVMMMLAALTFYEKEVIRNNSMVLR